ncbi:acetyltransferase, GNAT family [Treponema primitia ZAS-2]|uniref:Acetyltransferase, GNAT family n=1 Tax=Treponema primitia (strain ATCC BAA-887 / DSM 12427 / ZAS-2) TaxID=545694 RepID=F5YIC1_TREPZ|nr:GNAT family N-acetyltransferase [Treponema primitia]AEF84987.1 acetyltransferase, GNAT family [Treponema primitia ZAS-2]
MQFELTDALIDDLLFAMEDQFGTLFLDTQEGMVVSEDDIDWADDKDDRFISIPEWDSADGYRVMERFAASFKNPLIQKRLTGALNRGKGVFRAFKDALAPYPEAEKLWFAFKEQEMKKELRFWYNSLREKWGLERLGEEPEETEDLVLEDFLFRESLAADETAAETLHRLCLEEAAGGPQAPLGETPWLFPGEPALVAETSGGEFAAYIAGKLRGEILEIAALEVRPEYRGLGLGEALLTRLLETPAAKAAAEILIDVPQTADGFSRVLLRGSFTPYVIRYRKGQRKK